MGVLRQWCVLVVVLLMLQSCCLAKMDKSLYCSICRAVVEEVNARIGDIDPSKKVKVSSFRMGPDGKKHSVQKPYSRSNEYLKEVFGSVCESMNDYGLRQLPGGKLTIVRTRSRSGQEIFHQNVGFTDNIRQTFKGYCQTLIEENEDDMWTLFKLENLHAIESELCVNLAGMCTEDDLRRPFSGEADGNINRRNNFYANDDEDEEDEDDWNDDEDDNYNDKVISASSKTKGRQTEL